VFVRLGCVRQPRRRTGVLLPWQQRGQADPGRGPVVALQDALDGALAGERPDAEALELGEDGRGDEKEVPSQGGHVVMLDGKVKAMTAEEFNAAGPRR
jgi:hypothetical protein